MKQHLSFLLLGFVLASCAASLPYTTDYPLTDQVFHSRDGIFSGKIPRGWFASADDSVGTALNALLIKEDYSAALTLHEIKLDKRSADQVRKDGLKLLARLSLLSDNATDLSGTPETTEFDLGGKHYCSYERTMGNGKARIVVFTTRGKSFECSIRSVKGTLSVEEAKKMFNVQQTVLASLIY